MERKSAWGVLGTYAVTHAAVDAACAVLLWTAYEDGRLSASAAWSAFFAYNLLAFAVQPLVGLAADRLRLGRGAAAGGALLTATAAAVALVPGAIWTAVVLAGLGNAVFHVGGGVVSLRAAPGRAGPVGVFVAPGAAGLAIGILAGKAGAPVWPFVAALVVLAAAVALLPTPRLDATAPATKRPPAPASLAGAGMAVVALLLAVVGVRAFVGLTLVLPWKSDLVLLAALTAAVVTGKAAGGLLADRFGWRRIAVTRAGRVPAPAGARCVVAGGRHRGGPPVQHDDARHPRGGRRGAPPGQRRLRLRAHLPGAVLRLRAVADGVALGFRIVAAGGAHPAGRRGALVRARRPRPALAPEPRAARAGSRGRPLVRRTGTTAVASLLACLAALVAAPVALADSGIPIWPVNSFSLLFGGFVVVIVVLIVSAAVLARISRAERERRFERQYEARLAERSAADEATPAATGREAPASTPTRGDDP